MAENIEQSNFLKVQIMIKLLIFDLDGTIADTIYAIRDAVNMTMKNFGYPEKTYEEIRLAIGHGARDLIKATVPPDVSDDENLIDRVLDDYNNMYEITYTRTDRCYDGIIPAFEELVRREYKIAVLSNKQDIYVRKLTKQLFVPGIISYACGQTELPTKPDPTVPLMITDRFEVTPGETAFIGDGETDVMTAKNAGMLSVGCAYGYRGENVLRETGADIIIHSPSELTKIF